jgi:hypothetical protein
MKSPVTLLLIASMAYTSTAAPAGSVALNPQDRLNLTPAPDTHEVAALNVKQVPTVGSSGTGSGSTPTNGLDTAACILKSLLGIDCSQHPGGLGGATGGLGGLTDGLNTGGATKSAGATNAVGGSDSSQDGDSDSKSTSTSSSSSSTSSSSSSSSNGKGHTAISYNYSYDTLDEETIQVKITSNRPGGGGDKTGKKGTEKQKCTYNLKTNGRQIGEIIKEAAARCIH